MRVTTTQEMFHSNDGEEERRQNERHLYKSGTLSIGLQTLLVSLHKKPRKNLTSHFMDSVNDRYISHFLICWEVARNWCFLMIPFWEILIHRSLFQATSQHIEEMTHVPVINIVHKMACGRAPAIQQLHLTKPTMKWMNAIFQVFTLSATENTWVCETQTRDNIIGIEYTIPTLY